MRILNVDYPSVVFRAAFTLVAVYVEGADRDSLCGGSLDRFSSASRLIDGSFSSFSALSVGVAVSVFRFRDCDLSFGADLLLGLVGCHQGFLDS